MNRFVTAWGGLVCLVALALTSGARADDKPISIGGVYPHLAMMNNEGECGTGAAVPWADRLWVITYAPHKPMGSSDKLYEITPTLEQIIRPESIGGTPANRMIHRESKQLNIGPYFIDEQRNVRVIPYKDMPGRHTATARHLTDPANKLYIATMEEGLYEVDVNTLAFKCWINDGNKGRFGIKTTFEDAIDSQLPGYHGKGAYTGGGRLFYANNGEHGQQAKVDPTTPSGALAQWGGPGQDWQMKIREQFTEITGPGGIHGNDKETDPVWSLGWDHRSVLLVVMQDDQASAPYRLPKASFSYDGAHGWNTEWPRIREIGDNDDLLATMHGTFWHFPRNFSLQNTSGIKPRSNYLKVIGDFARWGDLLVLGCDDSAKSEFLNKRPAKAEHAAPQRSNSNLWFVKLEQLSAFGPALGSGGVWLNEDVGAQQTSDLYLFAGYDHRMLHLAHQTDEPITFIIEAMDGSEKATLIDQVEVPANGYVPFLFDENQAGEWVRITPKQNAKNVTAWYSYAQSDNRSNEPTAIFDGLATADSDNDLGGVIRSLAGDDLPLGLITQNRADQDRPFYLLNEKLELVPSDDKPRRDATWQAAAPDTDAIPLKRDGNSILVIEDGKRYRLPIAPHAAEDKPFAEAIGYARRVREIATERDMVNIAGTFYELPARNAGGFAHIRPIASHPFAIHDFCSWRGLLLMTGVDPTSDNPRLIKSDDGKAAVWAGVIDELWQLGKPVGEGGPWHESQVKADEPSDPYLMYGYDNCALHVTTDQDATITIQVDPSGTGQWHTMGSLLASPDETRQFKFYPGFNTHWVRLVSDRDATVTATFIYK